MAIFVAAGDESDGPTQRGTFLYGGYVAPANDWTDYFGPAWEQRVLGRQPAIPYMHMVGIRSPKWRATHGISRLEAERRVDEATNIIATMGTLVPVLTEIDGGHFRNVFRETRVIARGPQPGTYPMEPDYIGFIGFVYAALDGVSQQFPEAERVDFLIERKTKVSNRFDQFLTGLAEALQASGRPDLVRLMGQVIPGGKERLPLQAADALVWHFRRVDVGDADEIDKRRLDRMWYERTRISNGLTNDGISTVGERTKANPAPSPFLAGRSNGGAYSPIDD